MLTDLTELVTTSPVLTKWVSNHGRATNLSLWTQRRKLGTNLFWINKQCTVHAGEPIGKQDTWGVQNHVSQPLMLSRGERFLSWEKVWWTALCSPEECQTIEEQKFSSSWIQWTNSKPNFCEQVSSGWFMQVHHSASRSTEVKKIISSWTCL